MSTVMRELNDEIRGIRVKRLELRPRTSQGGTLTGRTEILSGN
jgi:hypothetical protein